MAKVALLIAVSEYESGLNPLPATIKDVEAMRRVLQNPEIGGFEVECLLNPDPLQMQTAIENLFLGSQRDDIVLLYFSGHGIKHDNGKLYFATKITRKNEQGRLSKASTVSADVIHDIINDNRSHSRRQVIILDCCFSGAFSPDARGEDDVSLNFQQVQLGGEGRAVLTSSTSTQYSFESVYTQYLVQGIETGEADENNDGFISVNELHQYVQRKVREGKHEMKPQIQAVIKEGFNIVLTKAPIHNREDLYKGIVKSWIREDGQISSVGRAALFEQQQRLEIEPDKATAIEDEVLKPHKDYLRRLNLYRKTQENTPISETDHNELKKLQQELRLSDEDVKKIKAANTQINFLRFIVHKIIIRPIERSKKIGYLSISICFCITAVAVILSPARIYLSKILPSGNTYPSKTKKNFSDLPSSSIPSGTFEYDASTSWSPIYPELETEITRAWSNFKLSKHKEKYLNKADKEVGSTVVIQKLINGKIAFALSSRPVLDTELQQAKKQNFSLIGIPVAKDAIAVAVHPELDIPGLTKENLRSIYTGEIDNWNRFGGPDRKITAYSRNDNSGTTGEFKKIVGIQKFDKKVQIVNTTTEAIKRVGLLNDGIDKGGIYYASASEIVPQCSIKSLPLSFQNNQSFVFPYVLPLINPSQCRSGNRNQLNFNAFKQGGDYPLTRDLIVVIKKNGSNEEKAGEAYVKLLKTDEGQSRIHDALNKLFVIY
ncbi:substrate-binding domain-containing protein [Aphanizomenon sp. PH219]|nr:substrate-binding domain-containing protein [Aphanizomenon sp. 202]MDK2459883.1 substrate-binding domain-containing protein [Aphanizomenon sp. PH219]